MTFSELIGKKILVGLSWYSQERELIGRAQYFGTVEAADEEGIRVRKEDGKILNLPPDLRSTKPAPAGQYRLRSTGEVVADPDYLSTWNNVKGAAE